MNNDQRSAVWARELTNNSSDMTTASSDVWVEHALRRIFEAASNGRHYVELLPGHPTDGEYLMLRELGYNVSVIKYQRDGEYTRVSW
jgi:hypothetical protein